jgi:hypothetical protein
MPAPVVRPRGDNGLGLKRFDLGRAQILLARRFASGYQNAHEHRFEEHCLVVGTLTRP